jgi:hypothetical protein
VEYRSSAETLLDVPELFKISKIPQPELAIESKTSNAGDADEKRAHKFTFNPRAAHHLVPSSPASD